jgi:hypothetical protein
VRELDFTMPGGPSRSGATFCRPARTYSMETKKIVSAALLSAASFLAALAPTAPASAACGNPCSGSITLATLACAPGFSHPAACPMDPTIPSPFVSTISIAAAWANGLHSVTLTGTVPKMATGVAGRLALTFGKPPYLSEADLHEWPSGKTTVTVKIPAGTTSIRVSPYVYVGAAQSVPWKLTFV